MAVWDAVDYLDVPMEHSCMDARRIWEGVARHLGREECEKALRQRQDIFATTHLPPSLEETQANSLKLSAAIAGGDLSRIRQLVPLVDPNASNTFFDPPLHLACVVGSQDVTRFLLEQGANISTVFQNYRICEAKPYQHLFGSLTTRGNAVNIACRVGRSVDFLELLLQAEERTGSELTLQDQVDRVHNAALAGNPEVVNKMLSVFNHQKYPERYTRLREEVVYIAVRCAHAELLQNILAQGVNPNRGFTLRLKAGFIQFETTPLLAVYKGSIWHPDIRSTNPRKLEIIRILLHNGADPNFEGDNFEFPKQWDTVRRDVYKRPHPVIYRAIAVGDLEIVQMLLEYGAVECAPWNIGFSRYHLGPFVDCAREADQPELVEYFEHRMNVGKQ